MIVLQQKPTRPYFQVPRAPAIIEAAPNAWVYKAHWRAYSPTDVVLGRHRPNGALHSDLLLGNLRAHGTRQACQKALRKIRVVPGKEAYLEYYGRVDKSAKRRALAVVKQFMV